MLMQHRARETNIGFRVVDTCNNSQLVHHTFDFTHLGIVHVLVTLALVETIGFLQRDVVIENVHRNIRFCLNLSERTVNALPQRTRSR